MSMLELLHSTFKDTHKIYQPSFFGNSLHNDYMSQTTMNTKRFWSPSHNKKLVQLSIVQAMSTKSNNQPNKHQCSMTIFELWVLSLNVQLLSLTRGGDGNVVVVKIVVKMNRECNTWATKLHVLLPCGCNGHHNVIGKMVMGLLEHSGETWQHFLSHRKVVIGQTQYLS
jgi:hypothetical protein